jgi:predicted MFS family arabinose efflux permease
MNENSSKRKYLIILVLGLSSIVIMADLVIIPIAGHLFEDFAGSGMGIFNYILSGPALIGAFSALLCGRLMYFVSKKTLLIITVIIFMIGSIAGDFFHNPYYMAVMRTLVGIGMGALLVLAMAIISDLFSDEKERSSAMGVFNGLMSAMGAVLGWVSGMVAAIEWRLVFRIYLATIPILLLIILFVPRDTVKKIKTADEEGDRTSEKMPWSKLMLLSGAGFVYVTIYCIVFYQIAMVVTEKAIGDVSFIGLLSALGTAGSFFTCFFFGPYYNKLKRFTPFIGFTGLACGFLLLYFGNTPLLAIISCTLLGAMFGVGFSYYLMYCTVIVPPGHIPTALSITTTIINVGRSLSTYISFMLQRALNTSVTGIMPVLAVILAVCATLSCITALRSRKVDAVVG